MSQKYLLLSTVLLFCSLTSFAQDEKKFITKDQVWKEQMLNLGFGMMGIYGAYKAGEYDGKGLEEAASNIGFSSKEELAKQMAFAEKSEDCLKKLSKANASSKAPVRYYGDSSELMIHVNGSKVQLYTPKGMVEIEGTNCKAVDGSKNVVDGLVAIAKRAVKTNTVGVGETQQIKEAQSKRVVDMLQSCGQVDSKFEGYSKTTLRESYQSSFQESSSKPSKTTSNGASGVK